MWRRSSSAVSRRRPNSRAIADTDRGSTLSSASRSFRKAISQRRSKSRLVAVDRVRPLARDDDGGELCRENAREGADRLLLFVAVLQLDGEDAAASAWGEERNDQG